MLKVIRNKIFLTRGDSATFALTIRSPDGEKYEPTEDDDITFTVKASVYDDKPLITKKAQGGVITLEPDDTEPLTFKTYVYDVVLRSPTQKQTVIPPSVFKICAEVEYGY